MRIARLLKIKLGTPDDMARLEAVRAGAPGRGSSSMPTKAGSAEVYADLAPHLVRLGVQLVEQPLPAGEDEMLAEIARPVPVCADESCHDRASACRGLKGKYDMVNIKLDKTGGLTEALALRDAAVAAGYGVMVGCMVGSIAGDGAGGACGAGRGGGGSGRAAAAGRRPRRRR